MELFFLLHCRQSSQYGADSEFKSGFSYENDETQTVQQRETSAEKVIQKSTERKESHENIRSSCW